MTAVGLITFTRHYWQCTCSREGAFASDAVLGIQGQNYSPTVQQHCCRLAVEASFDATSQLLQELLGVTLSAETVRSLVQGHGRAMVRFQAADTSSAQAFRKATGEVEFTVDASKVNTREEGWKDLKIGVFAKREAGVPATPAAWQSQRLPKPTQVVAFAGLVPAKQFRKSWRPRLRKLGVTCPAEVQVVADGAGWIWKGVERTLPGCVQTLDIFHACEHLSLCAQRIFGEGTPAAQSAYEQGRGLLVSAGWSGVCQWVGMLLEESDAAERERRRAATERLLGYFAKHVGRLGYRERLAAGRAIGSGQVEGQAKTLGLRLKRRGARWRRSNVAPMASLVCTRHTSHWDAYWSQAA
jgi:hypothetical protein